MKVSDIQKLIDRAEDTGGILAVPVSDTIKRSEPSTPVVDELPIPIQKTVSRKDLWRAQTPQFFPASVLRKAMKSAVAAGVTVTDEASAMEHLGLFPMLIAGSESNIKITHQDDLLLAEFYLSRESR